MQNFIKTIINGVQKWTKKEIKKSTADWSQNDENAADYVKNRTHYIDNDVILPETVFGKFGDAILFNEILLENETYTVIADNNVYTCQMHKSYSLGGSFILGNEQVFGDIFDYPGTIDTGEPFAFLGSAIGNKLQYDVALKTDKMTISIIGPCVKKISDIYLPGNIFTMNGGFNLGYETTASGDYSHAEGYCTTASGYSSHAEGSGSTASGYSSHAEGSGSTASGSYSHAEGSDSTASGKYSHAEGGQVTASGNYSHAEGNNTTAQCKSQHTQGEYNILDTEGSKAQRGKYVHIVGNGTSIKRSNAHTLDWNGVGWFQGGLQVGGNAQDDGAQTVMLNGDKEMILASSTEGSTKKFKITVDDSGVLSATEITV